MLGFTFVRVQQSGLVRFLKCAMIMVLPATALGSLSTTVTWSPSQSPVVTGYNLYYGTTSHDYTNMISVGNATNATINNLSPGTTYYFAATAHDDSGDESAFSNEASLAGYNTTPGSSLSLPTLPEYMTNDQVTYSLAAGSPANASINPTNGIVSWSSSLADANSTETITVLVTDLSNPASSTVNTLLINISDYLNLSSASVPVQTGQNTNLPLSLVSSSGLTNLVFNLTWPGNQLVNPELTFNAPFAGGTVLNQGTNLVIQLWTANGDTLTGTNQFAQFNFQAAAGQTSAFLELPINNVSANKPDGTLFNYSSAEAGEVVVIGTNSLLRAQFSAPQGRTMTVYANPGNYLLQYTTNLTVPIQWQPLPGFQQTNIEQSVNLDSANPDVFYRLQQL